MFTLPLIFRKGAENYRGKSLVVHFTKAIDVQRMTWANLSRIQERAIINAAGSKWKIGISDVGVVRHCTGVKGIDTKSEEDNK